MGTLTTNYGLLKAGNGVGADPVDDFVDVVSQLDSNLSKLDDFGYRATEYLFGTVNDNNFRTGNRPGDKAYDVKLNRVMVWNGVNWIVTNSKTPIWTDLPLNSGFENVVDGSAANCGFFIENDTVMLRGRMIRTALAIWVNGTANVVIPAGTLPTLAVAVEFFCTGGAGPSNTAQFYKVSVATTGAVTITRYGNTAQVAGASNNYVHLDGIEYGIS